MATEMELQTQLLSDLPPILQVVEGTLGLDTDDDDVAKKAAAGLQYLLSMEFARRQPALALLYELDFRFAPLRHGSRHWDFKIFVRLKSRVQGALDELGAEIQRVGVVMFLAAALSIPVAIHEIWKEVFDSTQTELARDMATCHPSLILVDVRPPKFGETSGKFDL